MHAAIGFILCICFFAGFHPIKAVPEGELNLAVGHEQKFRVRKEVSPLSESLFKHIVKQEHDYSCGSAALGTLLNYCLGENLSETQIINGLMKYGDEEQIKSLRAFSLWDMQQFVDALGYKSGGFNAEIEDIQDSDNWPCIVPLELFGYRHFVVLKGIHKDHVFVADPWRGNGSYTLNQFKTMWYKSILFKVFPEKECTVTSLRLKEEDLRFIDQDMQRTLMFDLEKPFAIPHELETDFYVGPSQRYKQ
ncbi:cysteine peptidase family C39 domain-containing protein [Desulfoluna sp.]|uniref:C39 family peptidase n=1 Tax=Desulfoluna sp. TaxID=2045199 RepID=UPI0026092D59|nr:cysteine peptidase family C39 domain-containing protein [Desulfoluna sp.]